jgi:hypothetical protein
LSLAFRHWQPHVHIIIFSVLLFSVRRQQSAAVAPERTSDLGWSVVVLVVVVVVSSSSSPLWTSLVVSSSSSSSLARPLLDVRLPAWSACDLRAKSRRLLLITVVVVVVASSWPSSSSSFLFSWRRLLDQRIVGTASRGRRTIGRRHLSSAVYPLPPSSSSLSSSSSVSSSSSSCGAWLRVVVVVTLV